MKNTKLILCLILCISAFLFFFKIGSIHILDGDTAYYASVSKNILVTGDWMTLGRPVDPSAPIHIVDKPPLLFWMMATGIQLFGPNELGFSFFHSLAAVLAVLFTFLLARRLYGEKVALYSSIILTTTGQFFYQSRSPLQDIPLTLFVLMTIYFFVFFDQDKKPYALFLSAASAALAVLTKGPIGLVLPGMIIFIYLIAEKRAHRFALKDYLISLPTAIAVFFLIVAPWYIYEARVVGSPFIDTMLSSTITRYFHPVDMVGNVYVAGAKPTMQFDFYVYLLVILLTSVPWAGFVYPSLYYSFKERKYFSQLPFIYVTVVILLFSASLGYKMARYILPAFPALAIVIAKAWDDFIESRQHSTILRAGNYLNAFFILPLLILGTFWLIVSFPAQQSAYQPIIVPMLVILCLGMIAGTIIFHLKKYNLAFWTLVVSSILAYTVMLPLADHYFKIAHPYQELCTKAVEAAGPNGIILQFGGLNTSFTDYYTGGRIKGFVTHNSKDLLKSIDKMKTSNASRIIIITEEPENLKTEFKKIGKTPKLLYNITCLHIFEYSK